MIVRPMIGDWELPCIERVELVQARRQARLGVPGLAGDLHQDLGAHSMTVAITGSLTGDDRRSGFLAELQAAFQAGEAVSFVADIVESSKLEKVVVVGFQVLETDEWLDGVRYRIVLRQYVEPPAPPAPAAELGLGDVGLGDLGLDDLGLGDLGLEDLAGSLLDGLDLPGLLGDVPALGDPTEAIRPALDTVRSAVGDVPDLLAGLRTALGV